MGCRGLHLALTPEQYERLRGLSAEARVELIGEEFEESYFGTDRGYETDKAWDAIHRCLSDGTLEDAGGEYPLNHAILGGECLDFEDAYVIRSVSPTQCADVAAALERVDESWLRQRYARIDPDEYGMDLSEEDFQYTWENLNGLAPFFRTAAQRGHWAVFTADQ